MLQLSSRNNWVTQKYRIERFLNTAGSDLNLESHGSAPVAVFKNEPAPALLKTVSDSKKSLTIIFLVAKLFTSLVHVYAQ